MIFANDPWLGNAGTCRVRVTHADARATALVGLPVGLVRRARIE
jgi:hypothetical protein